VVSRGAYAAKIAGTVAVTNMLGVFIAPARRCGKGYRGQRGSVRPEDRRHGGAYECAGSVALSRPHGDAVKGMVVSRGAYAAKIAGTVAVTNILGVLLYRARTAMQ